ncbi:hypothetical protein EBBID32_23830 [Sphingobium indicum BiD32]|uniref:Uncharacterized protein n=2 Tax=Sphingobium indicum TaxID=332055 RepID=N1MRG9_9SPHN|nr:hypothetical protein EBBID32_23830 [Sphingobium indicum BiD32]
MLKGLDMKRKILIASGAMMLACGGAMAQEAAPVATPAAVKPADPFAQAIAARQVADFARRESDPYAMLAAARMLKQVPMSDGEVPAEGDAAFSPDALFAEAKALARDDQALLLQIRLAQSAAGRGVTASAFGKGLVRRVQDVGARNAYRFTVTAKGGEPLRIGAIGDIGTSMYIRLLDASGRQLCLDDNADYAPVCAVTPRASGQYRIDIGNKSAAKSRTVILSN